MSNGYEEDLAMYEEAQGPKRKQLDNRALRRPISDTRYPRQPVSFGPEAPLGDVLDAMAEKRIGAVLIVEGGKISGIFAERDTLIKHIYRCDDISRPVREFMTPNPDCLAPHDSIAFALNRMIHGGYRHIPLIDSEGAPLGLLSMRDVVGYIVSYFPSEVLNVPPHSEHNPPDRSAVGG